MPAPLKGLLLLFLIASPVGAQTAADSNAITKAALAVRDSLKKSKTLQVGLSLGFRKITDLKEVTIRSPSINPMDSTLVVDGIDGTDIILSGVVTVFPWKERTEEGKDGKPHTVCGFFCRLGFVANVTLATFDPDNVSVFNKSVEGGIGLALRLAPDFALAATYERVFSRRLRNFVKEGQQLKVDGKILTTIDERDGRFFVDDNLSAVSFKFIYYF